MGMNFQSCSCLKPTGQEEKKSEFNPDSMNTLHNKNNNRNRHLSLNSEIRDSILAISTSREKTNFLLKYYIAF